MASTDEELFRALFDLGTDPLDAEIPDEVLDEMVRTARGDPGAIAKEAQALVAGLLERERLSWQDKAKQKRDLLEKRIGGGPRKPDFAWTGAYQDAVAIQRDAWTEITLLYPSNPDDILAIALISVLETQS